MWKMWYCFDFDLAIAKIAMEIQIQQVPTFDNISSHLDRLTSKWPSLG